MLRAPYEKLLDISYLNMNGIRSFFVMKMEMDLHKQAIEDFNNKFGLSVRVKALLKLMLPFTDHDLIPNVGSAIKHRNKIMHEGIGNDSLEKIDNVKEIIADCERLINALKIVGKEKKIFWYIKALF